MPCRLRLMLSPKIKHSLLVDSKTGPLYEFKDGVTHPIFSYVAKQRGISPDYVFSTAVFVEWYTGVPCRLGMGR